MTIQEYKNAGYEMSQQANQAAIDKAEEDVKLCYIIPILGDESTEDVVSETMALAFCLLLRRNIVKTRFGAERKTNQFATVMQQEAYEMSLYVCNIASPAIASLEAKSTLEMPFPVRDIIDSGYYII